MFRPLKTYQAVVDVVVGGLFGLTMFWSELEVGRAVAMNALSTVVVCVLFAGALALRRLSPGLALGIAWAGAIAQMAFARPPGPADLAIFAVLYATAAYGGRVVFWAGFGSAILGAAVITVYLIAPAGLSGGDGPPTFSWQVITAASAMLVAAMFALLLSWTVGALVRTGIRARENRRAQERAETASAAEHERVRIARDMHDVVAHSLAVVVAQADGARYAAAADPAIAADALGTISHTARAALSDVRMLLAQLRHREGAGPQPTLADLEQLFAQVRGAGAELRIDIDPAPADDPPAVVQLAVYRIMQEALTNALRHGDGPVEVRLAWGDDGLELVVRNALPAAAPPSGPTGSASEGGHSAPERRGHGLIGMRERAQLAGGSLDATARDGWFVVSATIPSGTPA